MTITIPRELDISTRMVIDFKRESSVLLPLPLPLPSTLATAMGFYWFFANSSDTSPVCHGSLWRSSCKWDLLSSRFDRSNFSRLFIPLAGLSLIRWDVRVAPFCSLNNICQSYSTLSSLLSLLLNENTYFVNTISLKCRGIVIKYIRNF